MAKKVKFKNRGGIKTAKAGNCKSCPHRVKAERPGYGKVHRCKLYNEIIEWCNVSGHCRSICKIVERKENLPKSVKIEYNSDAYIKEQLYKQEMEELALKLESEFEDKRKEKKSKDKAEELIDKVIDEFLS